MSKETDYVLKVNGEKTYNCVTYNSTEKVFTATLVTNDVAQVRSDTESVTLIEILNKKNQILFSTSAYNKLVSVNLRIGFGYDEETKNPFDLIQITFEKYDLESKVTELDEKIYALEMQLNPVVDFESMTLEQVKRYKIQESKQILREYLSTHPLKSACHGDKTGIYAITEEKQSLMMGQYTAYQVEKTLNPQAVLTWNETEKSCEEWAESEFLQLILEIKYRVYPLAEYQRKYEEEINKCNTKDAALNLKLDYDEVVYTAPTLEEWNHET